MIFANLLHNRKVSPLNPPANILTNHSENIIPNKDNTIAKTKNTLKTLLANLSASFFPFFTLSSE